MSHFNFNFEANIRIFERLIKELHRLTKEFRKKITKYLMTLNPNPGYIIHILQATSNLKSKVCQQTTLQFQFVIVFVLWHQDLEWPLIYMLAFQLAFW